MARAPVRRSRRSPFGRRSGLWFAELGLSAILALTPAVTIVAAGGSRPQTTPSSATTARYSIDATDEPLVRPATYQKLVRPHASFARPKNQRARGTARWLRLNGEGELAVVSGSSAPLGWGPVWRFRVEVEKGLPIDPRAFAARVVDVLSAPRGWGRLRGIAFQRVESGPVSFTVALAGPALTDRLCAPLVTNGIFSCYMAERAVINFRRWMHGASSYGGDLAAYRVYSINHEVGHALGESHAFCAGAGRRAPVMMQQTKGVSPCRPHPWPMT